MVIRNIYNAMIRRCTCQQDKSYKNYGGRGIKVCDRWTGDKGFENFFEDMGKRPTKNHSIDRINNDGNYEPSNCRWATKMMQANNRQNTRFVSINGKVLKMSDAIKKYKMDRKAILYALKTNKPFKIKKII